MVVSGSELVDSRSYRDVLGCPRCRWERKGDLRTGVALEVEREFWVTVSMQSHLSPSQLRALRSAQPFDNGESALQFVERIRNTTALRVGPFWPRYKAEEAVRSLVEAGLDATIS